MAIVWVLRQNTKKSTIFILSILTGFFAALAAIVLKNAVHLIRELLQAGFNMEARNYLYLAYPTVGILLAVLFVKKLIRRNLRHGIPNVLYSISRHNALLHPFHMFSSIVASALTVGFGGSVGLEGPTVATGAAIGSNVGRVFRLSYKQRVLLLACACSSALAAIFKAPVASIVFSLEVIMLDLTMASIVPILLATSTATLTSYFFLGQETIYPVQVKDAFELSQLHYYVILGILTGLFSVYVTKATMYIEGVFEKFRNTYLRIAVGGGILGALIFLFPALYGEGYEVVNACLKSNYDFLFTNSPFYPLRNSLTAAIGLLFLLAVLKVVAASVTFGSGGVGGLFAPTLFIGSAFGLLFAFVVNVVGGQDLPIALFALAGMAGTMAGVLHAPLTGIFLIADLTGGYQLFLPLMICSTLGYLSTRLFVSHSVYTHRLAKRKELITHNKDESVLTLMKVESLLETDFSTVMPDTTLGDLVEVVAQSKRNVYPVVDHQGYLVGILTLNDIRHVMFKQGLYGVVRVRDLMYMPEAYVELEDDMETIARKIQESGHFNLPVLKGGKYAGCVSRANVFSKYRKMLQEFSEH